jgi:hypothetical protein
MNGSVEAVPLHLVLQTASIWWMQLQQQVGGWGAVRGRGVAGGRAHGPAGGGARAPPARRGRAPRPSISASPRATPSPPSPNPRPQMDQSFSMQVNMGVAGDGESDEVKRIFLEGNPVLLAITMVGGFAGRGLGAGGGAALGQGRRGRAHLPGGQPGAAGDNDGGAPCGGGGGGDVKTLRRRGRRITQAQCRPSPWPNMRPCRLARPPSPQTLGRVPAAQRV